MSDSKDADVRRVSNAALEFIRRRLAKELAEEESPRE